MRKSTKAKDQRIYSSVRYVYKDKVVFRLFVSRDAAICSARACADTVSKLWEVGGGFAYCDAKGRWHDVQGALPIGFVLDGSVGVLHDLLPLLPSVKADVVGFSYVVSVLNDQIAYHERDMASDPDCHRVRIDELQAAIKKLTGKQACV